MKKSRKCLDSFDFALVLRKAKTALDSPEDAAASEKRRSLFDALISGNASVLVPLSEEIATQLTRELRIIIQVCVALNGPKACLSNFETSIQNYMVERYRQERDALRSATPDSNILVAIFRDRQLRNVVGMVFGWCHLGARDV